MKYKILLISQNFYPELGSAANRMKNIFEQLQKKGFNPMIVTTDPSYPNREIFKNKRYFDNNALNQLEGIQIHRIQMRFDKQHPNLVYRLLYYLELTVKLKYYLKRLEGFENIFVSSPNIFMAWATLFFKKNKTAKYFLEIRDLWPDSFLDIGKFKLKYSKPILKFLEKEMYKQADDVVINNPFFETYIKNMIGNNKHFIYMPNAITKSEVQPTNKLEAFSVIYTGNIGYAQDVEQLISIARQLNAKKVHFTAIVYGVKADRFRSAVKQERMHYVHLIPPLKREECLAMISTHHVSLSILKNTPVFMNVMPGKIVDSICSGTPIVSNLGETVCDLIQQSGVGFSKENASSEEIVNYILELKNNPQLLKQTIDNTQSLRDADFIWENNIEQLTQRLRRG
ncbi:glycosyltransferase family 4 protein [Staphylococcus coagulans]|uniref:glycosyltransferase family 4 protein n=1 Tax=Staphylococcus coagulans TaxID=74706 RepID=UPI001F4BFE8A|nr:glycosyltransferase family 4 protein [Staphylococcus coagulans]UNB45527.1 glycosyltransferase family 4 protein [Staphylococcus coagulans]